MCVCFTPSFCNVVKRVDHMGVLSCSQTWEWGQLYVLQVHNCPLCIRYTLHKVVSRLACSNYVRFFCCGRFLTGGFCCSHPMGTRVIDMGTNKYVVTCAYCPLFPWITQNNMDLMASGPTRPVPYITFFFSWSYNPVNDNNFWYITEGKNKTKKKNMSKISSEISDLKINKNWNACKSGFLPHLRRQIKQAISFLSAGHLNYFWSHEYWSGLLHPLSGGDTKEKANGVRWVSVHDNNMVTIYPYTDLWK